MSLDLNNLKEQIQSIFQTANTTTATQDLSSGLTNRVQRVLKVNPSYIPVQSDWYPYVSIFIEGKEIELKDIAATQLAAKREGTTTVKIVGAVWNSALSDDEIDAADEDCEDLMENIEQILRGNPTLAGAATWSAPTRVTYHNASLGEGVHLRAGVLDLEVTNYY